MGKRLVAALAVMVVSGGVTSSVYASPKPVSKAQYLVMLKRANARVSKVETAAEQGLKPSASRSDITRLLVAWASTESQLGRSFAGVRPPLEVAAANVLLARGERTFGAEIAAAAHHLPQAKAKIGPFLEKALGSSKGAAMIDRALAKLKAAGYRVE